MLRRHFQPAGRMVQDQRFQIGPGGIVHIAVFGKKEVVTDAAADIRMADAFHRINLLIQFHQAGMRSIHIRARSGPQAGFSAAFRAQRRILPHHSVHVGRRGTQVGNVPRETRQFRQLLHLF